MQKSNLDRYIRQTIFKGVGQVGQQKLLEARILILGCGALGTAIANILVRAGIGHTTIVDRDFIELNNLQRQTLYNEQDLALALPKAVAATNRLRLINSEVVVEAVVEDFNYENAQNLVASVDLVLDGTDNFETRYLLNDICVMLGKPWIYSGVIAAYGLTSTIIPHTSACFRCLFPEPPPVGSTPTCDTAGVVGPIVGMIGAMAAGEAIKLITGQGVLNKGIFSTDLWQLTFDRLAIEIPQADCICCQQNRYEFWEAAGQIGSRTATLCGRNAVQVSIYPMPILNLSEVADRLKIAGATDLIKNEYLLRFRVNEYEWTLFSDARAIIKNISDPIIAKGLYARYIGL